MGASSWIILLNRVGPSFPWWELPLPHTLTQLSSPNKLNVPQQPFPCSLSSWSSFSVFCLWCAYRLLSANDAIVNDEAADSAILCNCFWCSKFAIHTCFSNSCIFSCIINCWVCWVCIRLWCCCFISFSSSRISLWIHPSSLPKRVVRSVIAETDYWATESFVASRYFSAYQICILTKLCCWTWLTPLMNWNHYCRLWYSSSLSYFRSPTSPPAR